MTQMADIVNIFLETAKQNCTLENIVYIAAYPNTPKSSLMKNTVAAFSLYNAETEPAGLGSDIHSGQIQVMVSVYVPFSCKLMRGSEAAEHICTAICRNLNITGIKTCAPESDANTECMVTRVIFTIDDEIIYGQESV